MPARSCPGVHGRAAYCGISSPTHKKEGGQKIKMKLILKSTERAIDIDTAYGAEDDETGIFASLSG
jgi:hypothetical protein